MKKRWISNKKEPPLASLTFYGGIGEIGGNKILLEDKGTRVFLDFGMSFGRKGDFYEEYLQPRTNNGLRDLIELGVTPGRSRVSKRS
jgi:ribonuclease J